MTTEQKRKAARSRRRKRRRMKRKIQMWVTRILVLSAAVMLLILLLQGVYFAWCMLIGAQETGFFGATIIEDLGRERDPNALLVVVDAGHGGKDQGTCSGNILEKDINLAVAKKLAKKLKKSGAEVIMTRDEDVKIELEDRAAIANEENADIFVSIHCNYYEKDAGIKGLECYYQESSEGGEELAERIVGEFESEDRVEVRGIKTAGYRVLRKTRMPAVLVELGYMSNRTECKKLTDEDYQDLLAEKIAAGILAGTL